MAARGRPALYSRLLMTTNRGMAAYLVGAFVYLGVLGRGTCRPGRVTVKWPLTWQIICQRLSLPLKIFRRPTEQRRNRTGTTSRGLDGLPCTSMTSVSGFVMYSLPPARPGGPVLFVGHGRLNVRVTAVDLAQRLPDIATIRALSQAFALLDAILSPGGYATYAFDSRWGEDEELASMNNGSGDEYSIVFTASGVFIRGFDHESPMSPYGDDDYATWPGLVESVPQEFAAQVAEPAFCDDDGAGPFLAATVCMWRRHDDTAWRTGDIDFPKTDQTDDPDGSAWMFRLLAEGTPEAYCAYAADYFEVVLDPADVRQIFEHRPLTADLVRRINSDTDFAALAGTLQAIGYPSAGASA